MTSLAHLQMRAFLRRWPLALIGGLALLGVVAVGAHTLYLAMLPDVPVLDALGDFARYSIVLPLIVAVATYEFVSAPRLTGMEEAVDAHPEMTHRHWLAMMVPPSALVVVLFLACTTLKLIVIQANRLTALLAGHMLAEATLNVLAPCVIAMLLGALAARRLGRYAGYAVIMLFAFLIGPYAEIVPMLAQMGIVGGGWGLNLYPAYDLVRVLPPDSMWSIDALYGLPLEIGRWALAGFWILGLLALFLPAITNPKTRGVRPARILLAVLAALCLVSALMPSSVLRRDYRFFGGSSTVTEQIYYQMQKGKQHPQRELLPDFKVDRYDIHLAAGRQLGASVSMDLSGPAHDGPYRFTLYHGYRVKRVYGADGEALSFVQEGDYITVTTPNQLRRITLEYGGSGGICIANYQGVFLPGYFPYYPVPGFVRVWNDLLLAPVVDVASKSPTQFSVRFDTSTPLASNLQLRNGRFEGRAVAPSFVGGLLAQTTVAGHQVVYYPASGVDPEELPGLIASLNDLGRSLELTESPLATGVTLIQMPELAQAQAMVFLPNTLFLSGIDQSLAVDVLLAATPMRTERENLKEAFARVVSDPTSLDGRGGARPTDDEVAKLERARLSASSDMEVVEMYYRPAKDVVFRLFREKVREMGVKDALRDTYRYLSSDTTTSELQFLTRHDDTEAP